MAEFLTFTPEQQQEFDAWVAARPPIIQEIVAKYPPNRLYRIKSGNRVCIQSYEEDGTVTGFVSGKYNLCTFERCVFGIPLDDLEECDLPTEEEKTGAVLTDPNDIENFIDKARPFVLREREKNG